jgi:hypothetical protein
MKIDKKYIKIGAITLASIGVIWGGYKIVKHFINKNQEDQNNETPVDVVIASNEVENKTVAKPTFSADKIVKLGSKGDEAKTVQTALNNIISDAVKAKPKAVTTIDPSRGLIYDKTFGWLKANTTAKDKTEASREYIASHKPLVADGIFGAKSVSVLKGVVGKSSATYNEVKNKRLSLAKQFGLGNPYSTK